jgi:glucosamine--fructose-6-phosphate aminotransferase (isomerizing)
VRVTNQRGKELFEEYNMWNELSEVPHLIKENLSHFEDTLHIDFDKMHPETLNHIKIIASGSSNNAGKAGRYIFEEIVEIPVSVEYASEAAHKRLVLDPDTLIIAISQSGKTADTLSAIKKIRNTYSNHILAVTNIKDSAICKLSDSIAYIGAGEEKAVPATKTFSLQLLVLFKIALSLAEKRGVNPDKIQFIKDELYLVPEQLLVLKTKSNELDALAQELVNKNHLVFLSRGINYTLAKEGALKFKETSYVDANGYPAGEFMHGYVAMLDEKSHLLVLEFVQDNFLKANILKIKQKSASNIYGLTMNPASANLYNQFISLPPTKTRLTSIFLFACCLQMMSFFAAKSLGYNPDKPRSLSKYLSREQ